MIRARAPIATACLLALAACGAPVDPQPTGTWHAWLDSPGGKLPFELEIVSDGDGHRAFVHNGIERLPVGRVETDAGGWTFRFEHYDAELTGRPSPDGHRMDGRWRRTGKGGEPTVLEFHAVREPRPRFDDGDAPDLTGLERIDGRWSVDFSEDDQPALGLFDTEPDGSVVGTFMTTTGDYRYLGGSYAGGRLRLSVFDGAHAFLFDARLQEDGTLVGDFWSRDSWHETWTATREDDATLPDGFTLTRWVGGDLASVAFPDLDGHPRSLADPEFAGKARIVEIFGSWCPNCNDATADLVELHREYGERGLSILGLAFEMTGDFERDAAQVRVYAEHHGIEYPLLVAGLSDKSEASKVFPLIDRVRSFPTTIFMDADGRVRAVHQGYNGPATGAAHDRLRERFRELIEELLADGAAR